MIAAGGSRRPQRRHGGEAGADGVPVEPVGGRQRRRQADQAGLVREDLFDGEGALSPIAPNSGQMSATRWLVGEPSLLADQSARP